MVFSETDLNGVYVIELERFEDERGFFAPAFSQQEFERRGLESRFVENNISYSSRSGTLRGLHYQVAPHGQAKLVRCTRGAIFDVALDLRPASPTFRRWVSVELTAENRLMFYLPSDVGHGFQTLEDDTEVFYQVSTVYRPDAYRGLRWDDPAFGITWPLADECIILARDNSYPDFLV
ncbi:MAG TPA: dTDP-4-dehydrorhamnose 3,5-epimerase [Pyrinomonadaceae bacterium]|jgi:dTDP-4-dehydrorhamnose 3,5-epimerase